MELLIGREAVLMNHASPSPNETVWLESGERAIATFVLSVREVEEALVFAVLISKTLFCQTTMTSLTKFGIR